MSQLFERRPGRRRGSFRRTVWRALVLGLFAAVVLSPAEAPGTVQEQRERLPPPAKCKEDDVAGFWKSHQYNPRYRDWVEFTLEIHRVEGSQTKLEGTIVNHTWKGDKKHEQPGQCDTEVPWRARISMDAVGTVDNGLITFRGTRWELDEVICGRLPLGWGYNLDKFTGQIDFDAQEFQSVNNDGGRSVNEPTLFRRVGCLEEGPPAPPAVDVKPPALFPKEKKGGCGC